MKSFNILTAGTLLTAALACAPAHAGGDSGFYIGAGVGQASVDNVDGLSSFNADDTGYKLIGGYNFGIIPLVDLSAELEYVDFGNPADGSAEVDGNAIAAFGVAGVNLGPVGVFGKVGAFSWDADASDGSLSVSDDGTDMAYGIGARFHIGSFQIRAEYELFDVDIADLDLLSASFIYTF